MEEELLRIELDFPLSLLEEIDEDREEGETRSEYLVAAAAHYLDCLQVEQ